MEKDRQRAAEKRADRPHIEPLTKDQHDVIDRLSPKGKVAEVVESLDEEDDDEDPQNIPKSFLLRAEQAERAGNLLNLDRGLA